MRPLLRAPLPFTRFEFWIWCIPFLLGVAGILLGVLIAWNPAP